MSVLVYKQRHRHPNKKDTPGANYAHIRYIATRPRVMKNENADHGLFGKMEPGAVTEFGDWRDVAKAVYANSKKGTVMYRSVVSFAEDTARELLLKDQKSWQRYIENHILTIAEKNGIRREDLQWAAAVHGEKKHPHIHVVFWDRSVRAGNPYTPPQIPNAIRIQMIKDTFAEKILAYTGQKDMAVKEMRRISDALVERFEEEMRCKSPGRFKAAARLLEEELEQGFSFDRDVLAELSGRLFALRASLPEHGRIAYQFLSQEAKEQTDETVLFLPDKVPEIRRCFERYVDAKCRMAGLYSSDEGWLLKQKGQFEKEAGKILANRVLSGVKAICRLEKEKRGEAYLKSHREYLASRIIMEALDMLAQAAWEQEEDIPGGQAQPGELSKEAKKELFQKNQDKGYEH
ncbi:MAG: relaxase MobL [Lachnospiraceae bacterium]|nr:relaxase MobL [Lachnospiraceae bacterium]